ncbi:MAG TPA: guanylate kinase [Candidatus Kapabacteria bacterium]|nr:guanylate kinase [Candidatus Kapabacteria bacterium]
MKQLIVISAPSGAGKTTITKRILQRHSDKLTFSISATTRQMRTGERDGIDYYFLLKDEFVNKIKENALIEYEEIFGNYYGTLVSEIDRAKEQHKSLLFDIDVKGGISIRTRFPDDSLLIFIAPPSLEVLRNRLTNRKTETEEVIERRLARAKMEMEMASVYDHTVINDDLETAITEVEELIIK